MGYSVDIQDIDAAIFIEPDRVEELWGALVAYEQTPRYGYVSHISWCDSLENIWERNRNHLDAVTEVFRQYGFDDGVRKVVSLEAAAEAEDRVWVSERALEDHVAGRAIGGIVLDGWGGSGDNKIGSDWDGIWTLIGKFASNPATWIVLGEDGSIWAEIVDGKGGHRQGDVSYVVSE